MKSIALSAATCVVVVAALLSSGCHTHDGDATPATAAAVTPPPANSPVQLPPASLAQIQVDQTHSTDAPQVLTTTGKVQFNEDHMARILPPVGGQVQQLTVQIGDAVHAGQILFMLNSRDVAAALAEHTSAHRDLDLAQKTQAMTQDLFDHQAASKLSLQQAENELAKQTARVQQDEQVLRVLGLDMPEDGVDAGLAPRVPVRSPLNGVVTQRAVTDGQFVDTQGEPLLTIADLSTVWVLADVFERDLHEIALGQRADVTTTAYPDEHFVARVAQIGNTVDPETHTVTVRFLASNSGGRLKPGMFATSTLYLQQAHADLTVPSTAVFMEDGKSYSYVQTGARGFTRRQVSTVPDGDNRVRVMAGLRPGDKIVTDGVLLLRQQETAGGK